ncbi:hypothetical protein PV325_014131 [Microctonus aethiopoides]|uniref:Inositol-pentakisphosphate 2-kinase n=1 Tax=Microctonus aethiopoides TaxID=144406 RepID=A0AA39FIC6_9HYME|nr:hypothetical protein PV325_014131 [Microctonus aethiopoides]KAK0170130.1 hypothetical protein PV328_010730 [Microctonus aethiopoides]
MMSIGLMAGINDDNDQELPLDDKIIIKYDEIDANILDGYIYRGEGNANIVIALPSARSVLRFRKIKSTDVVTIDEHRARVEFEWKFFKQYISVYLDNFVNLPEILQCHPRDIPDWDRLVELVRPSHRRHKNVYEEYASKMPDYSLLPAYLEDKFNDKPTYCIEIKPKQGFVPQADRYLQKCPYCINQFYKITKKKISQRSRYCPCDLFSGDVSRLHRAIDALVESPQNNFIVFKSGFHAWGEGCERKELERLLTEWFSDNSSADTRHLFEDLNYLVGEALLREFNVNREDNNSLTVDPIKLNEIITAHSNKHHLDYDTIHKAETNLSLLNEQACKFPDNNLPRGSVLGRIFRMQQLHCTSANVIYSIYSSWSASLNEQKVYFSSPEELKLETNDNNRGETFISDEITLLRNYLLFSIARDCSILLAFREINFESVHNISANNVILLPRQNRYFTFNAGITDVDSKKLNRIEKHRQRTIRALNSITID